VGARVVVVGGGIAGLSAAWWLARRGASVTLVERFTLGHDRGSSHGRSRITRSAYADALYVRLMAVAHGEQWPALEADLGRLLLHRRDGCFFGWADGPFADYVRAVRDVGADVVPLDAREARLRFPWFAFTDAMGVLWDRTSAVVAAADTIEGLAGWVRRHATVLEGCRVHAIDPGGPAVVTDRGRLDADRVIVTAGAWVAGLLPALAEPLVPVRQTVVYAEMDGDHAGLPVWIWKGHDDEDLYYGLPEFQRPGIKLARHAMGPRIDPDAPIDPADTGDVVTFLRERFTAPLRRVVATERCLYTVAPREDFVIDEVPGSPGVIVGSACSGHGFKLGPLTGRLLAEIALDGRTSVAPFEADRDRFRCP